MFGRRMPPVMHAWLLDRDGTDTGRDGPLGQATVADDLPMAGSVEAVALAVNPVGGLRARPCTGWGDALRGHPGPVRPGKRVPARRQRRLWQ